MSESSCETPTLRGNGAPSVLRLPAWVLSKIATRSPQFTGQLRVNFYLGGVSNIEWRTVEKPAK